MRDTAKFTVLTQGIIALFIVGIVLYELQTVLLPFFVAIFLSYIFKPIVLYLESKKVPMILSLLLVSLAVAAVLFGMSLLVYSSIASFIGELPKYEARLNSIVTDCVFMVEDMARKMHVDISGYAWTDIVQITSITAIVTSSVGSFIVYLSNFVLVMLFMFFILAGSGQIAEKLKHSLSTERSAQFAAIIENIDRQVRQYLFAKTLISLATGVVTYLVLLFFGVDFPLLWGFLTFILNFIPNIGSAASTVFPFLLAFLQFDSLTRPILILLLLIGAHNLIGNILEPKLLARSLNLSPLLVLVSLLFWGWLWGVWGMVLAVPITSMIKIICENIEVLHPVAALMSGTITRKKKVIIVA